MKGKSNMRIKTYFVQAVEDAMAQAQVDLGEDAMLLNTRRVMQAGKPTGYEVVIGVDGYGVASEAAPEVISPVLPQAAPQAVEVIEPESQAPVKEKRAAFAEQPAAVVKQSSPPPLPERGPDPASSELKRLRAQMDEIQELLLRSTRAQALGGRVMPELGELFSTFLDAQMDPLLAKDIVERVEAAMAADAFLMDPSRDEGTEPVVERIKKFLRAELEARIRIVPTLGVHGGAMSPVTVLVGPTGGGKTTTVAKLAVAASWQAPVHLLSLDRSRPGASHQLRALAVAPKITFSAIDALDRLPEVLMEARKGSCVLVDTAGFAASEWSGAETLAAVLAKCPELDVHLAVPAYMNGLDLRRVMERYQIFQPAKLLVTKMDEAEKFGPVFSETVRAGLALSFVTHGPRVPDDIEAASLEELVALTHGRPIRGAQRAA